MCVHCSNSSVILQLLSNVVHDNNETRVDLSTTYQRTNNVND